MSREIAVVKVMIGDDVHWQLANPTGRYSIDHMLDRLSDQLGSIPSELLFRSGRGSVKPVIEYRQDQADIHKSIFGA